MIPVKIRKNFMKDVPMEKQEIVKSKIDYFSKMLPDKKTLSEIPKGFWVRNVRGTDIYKFRVNSGDRILFKYEQMNGEETLVLLSFQTHDRQIRAAKSITAYSEVLDYTINEDAYENEPVDKEIDDYVVAEVYSHLESIRQEIIFEDEYINLAVEYDEQQTNILSLQQFECLTEVSQPVIIFGCAGSGKTNIALRKLLEQCLVQQYHLSH
ncbi:MULTISPECIES: hypothetical protein [unclassified Paenibacillus]|uniref:hypothetical protein n=1 Tax=unclassified Paenibacillus TaxID=185978 RepID=UPI002404A234|nr:MULTISPECIES: hypothetical protein [unclassified Paenibacillus]MDF9840773.1 hypothetical protein [Paenibacillus sp. PastF-2]MDF9847356.1 hypothetical protein [Paenibacillus sp. PastM-2]MDF9854066.1 hypothetical protein [Paenibacillus sp. PastF-1]MDH6479339.1 hypothetical protein [Paenibacillus sp. PastH-2]MDH6506928.1 hypothetical protein [Paenibacillus sp. PastM-3]